MSGRRALLGVAGATVVVLTTALDRREGEPPGTAPGPPPALAYDERQLRPGDVLFRRGDSFASRLVLAVDSASPYSHVGIVARDAGHLVVVHATPDDGRAPTGSPPGGMVVAEPLAHYLAPGVARAAAVYRLRSGAGGAGPTAAAAARVALALARARVPFDPMFDLDTPDRVYCTELVWRAYGAAGARLLDGSRDALPTPFRDRRAVLLPSALLRSPALVRVAELHAGALPTPPPLPESRP